MNHKAVVHYIAEWLKNYAHSAGVRGFVVGISGGIDSAVTSALCARTGMETLCLELPIHQDEAQVSRGRKHIAMLMDAHKNVRAADIDLTGVYDAFVEKISHTSTADAYHLALANTRSRLRMSTLYFFAGIEKYLVTGTGNKIEDFGVGFFTKYGDGGVDLSPIADLMKSEVYAIGKELGIIAEIMDAAPSDGLWGDSRTDEDQLGATYPELEWAMKFEGDTTSLNTRQEEVLAIYKRLNKANQHKIKPIPVCIIPEWLRSTN